MPTDPRGTPPDETMPPVVGMTTPSESTVEGQTTMPEMSTTTELEREVVVTTGLGGGAVAAIVIIMLMLLAVLITGIAIVLILLLRRRSRYKDEPPTQDAFGNGANVVATRGFHYCALIR